MDSEKILQVLIPFCCFVVSGSIHEFSHGLAAYFLGDDTAKVNKRLTLNPIAHVDPWGTIFFPLLSAFTALPVLGWMRPVPINSLNFKKNGKGMAITAFAGPYSNLLQALFAFILSTIYLQIQPFLSQPIPLVSTILYNYIYINLILMVFNLLPFPPLDGGWILRYFLPLNQKALYDRLYPYGKVLLYFFIFTKGTVLFSYLTNLILKFLFYLCRIHWTLSALPFLFGLTPLLIFYSTLERNLELFPFDLQL